MFDPRQSLPDGTYVVLVRSLYATLLPTTIIAVSFLSVGVLIGIQTPDRTIDLLTGIGTFFALLRLANLLHHRSRAADEALDAAGARILERRFALCYFAFACVFGVFAARAFLVATPGSHMLVIGLLFGYGAGVAAGVSMRPRIAVSSMLVAIVPTSLVALWLPSVPNVAIALLLLVFMSGGIQSIEARYRTVAENVTLRRTFETLARADDLTGLPNRLSLREGFDRFLTSARPGDVLAVHCLDLDRFKPVNDLYGHPAGDALLRAVSERLNGVLRRGDIAARLGGDEFVILQTGVTHRDEAEMLARRVLREIAKPFAIDGHRIQIGTCVGYALFPDDGADLETLIGRADEALVGVKRGGGGVAAYRRRAAARDDRDTQRLSA
jgi:diguanylate cyclase (GGDEF)-like protein